ncbi:class I lanthipeptide [Chitinophaga nivalis]|uniref:Class I lanthipeptide n=1 Tax=Chitinophaga nivalis TaxID=2991709 RepID=A0ABT3ILW3_9BACT|nr:class I lanthipeptide [Chitinophaga nivalis]MCW3465544.1 class I lanthipeptide [Chitinophaga nivalis]MCW3484765.1 class I lanthipeptide [Chitinophaga nivalis]
MKKMKVDLNKKLFLNKSTVVSLSSDMQQQLAGGVRTMDVLCTVTINPRTKLSRQAPRPDCLCCADPVVDTTIIHTIAQ